MASPIQISFGLYGRTISRFYIKYKRFHGKIPIVFRSIRTGRKDKGSYLINDGKNLSHG